MKMAATGILLVVVGMATMGMTQSWSGRYVEASRFVLKDSNGKVRGQWVAEGDSSGFSLYDPQEKPVMELLNASDQHAVKLSLISPKGAVSLWATSDDVGVIARDSNGPYADDRIFLGLRNSPSVPMLRLNDSKGNVRVFFTSGSGSGVGVISDDRGEPFWAAMKKSDAK
jgi:hypothetical protein